MGFWRLWASYDILELQQAPEGMVLLLLVGYHGNQSLTFFIIEGLYRGYTTPKGERLPTLLLGANEPLYQSIGGSCIRVVGP